MKLMMRTGMALLAVGAAGLMGGCATDPVGEAVADNTYFQTAPMPDGGIYMHRYQLGIQPSLQNLYRPYGIQPVGERILPDMTAMPTLDGEMADPLSPYGPNAPCVRSLWW